MGSVIYAAAIIVVFFGMIYGMYGGMVKAVVRWSKKPITNSKGKQVQPRLSFGEAILCYIPFVQVCKLRKALYRTAMPWNILSIISAVLIGIRLLNLLVPIHGNVLFFTSIGIYVGIFLHLIIYGYVTANCAKLYGFKWWIIILSAILPYWVGFFLRSAIPVKMIDLQKEKTFDGKTGRTGNTRIESKPRK